MRGSWSGKLGERTQPAGTADWYTRALPLNMFHAKNVSMTLQWIGFTASIYLYRKQSESQSDDEDITALYRTYDPAFTDPAGEAFVTFRTANIVNLGAASFRVGFKTIAWTDANSYVYVWATAMRGS